LLKNTRIKVTVS